jgi:hypothetical protein
MSANTGIIKGVVRGRTIELEREPGLPDGQVVSVLLRPAATTGDGLRRAFGAWSDDAGELDAFLEQVRRDRDGQRPEPTP